MAHVDEVINDLNQTIKMNFKNWTLLSGDHELLTWAIFVKSEDGEKVAMKMFFGDKVLTISSEDDLRPIVKLGDDVLNFKDNEVIYSSSLRIDVKTT